MARGRDAPRAWSRGARPGASGVMHVREAEPSQTGKLEGRAIPVETERKAEHVDFGAFLPPNEHPGQAEERELHPRAARREPDRRTAGQEVLADRGRREVETELRHGPG